MASYREQVVAEIRSVIARQGTTVNALVERLGRSQTYWARRIPTRASTPPRDTIDVDDLARIAEVLGVEVADLLPQREQAASGAGQGAPPPHYRPAHEGSITDPLSAPPRGIPSGGFTVE